MRALVANLLQEGTFSGTPKASCVASSTKGGVVAAHTSGANGYLVLGAIARPIAVLLTLLLAGEPSSRPRTAERRRPRATEKRSSRQSTVLSWRAFIGEAPLDVIKRSLEFEWFSAKALSADRDRFSVPSPKIRAPLIPNPGVFSEKF